MERMSTFTVLELKAVGYYIILYYKKNHLLVISKKILRQRIYKIVQYFTLLCMNV